MNPTGNTMLITGGGSGIGRELARRFHDLGNTVIVAGRRADALAETASGYPNILTAVLDVEDGAGLADFAARVVTEHPALNILVNNAGMMRSEDLSTGRDLADAQETIVTNLLGPIRLTDALIEHLTRQSAAVIVNVTSGLAYVPLVSAPTYSATKAALHSYTVSLRDQLEGRVEVIELIPPGVQTDLTPGQATRDGYMPLGAFIDEVMTLFTQTPTPSEIVVERVRLFRDAEAEGRVAQLLTMLRRPADQRLSAPVS